MRTRSLYPVSLLDYREPTLARSLAMTPKAAVGNVQPPSPQFSFDTATIFFAFLIVDLVQCGEANKAIPMMPIAQQSGGRFQ